MGQRTYQYTFTGTEGHPQGLIFVSLPAFTTPFTITATLSSAAGAIYNFQYAFAQSFGGTTCWSNGLSFLVGNITSSQTWTPGTPSGSWHCMDWGTFAFNLASATNSPPAGMVLTVVLDSAGLSASTFCEYGVEKQQPANALVNVAWPLIEGLNLVSKASWALPVILAHAGSYIYLEDLCANNPPAPQTITVPDWTLTVPGQPLPVAYSKILANFNNEVWHKFCKCQDGPPAGPGPTQPLTVDWTAPTYIVTTNNTTISETQISQTLNQLFQYFLSLQFNNTTTYPLTVQAAQCCDVAYKLGTVHVGLTDSASISVSGLAGLLVEITDRPEPTRVLEGNPPYLWDMGWVSMSTGDGMLDEKRITRDQLVWLPPIGKLATSFGYFAFPEITLKITELLPA